MKNLFYILITVFVIGIMAMGFTEKANKKMIITIEAIDSTISSEYLSQSAIIITSRLKDFCPEKFELNIIPEKHQIQVKTAYKDVNKIEKLLTHKGSFAFYETYDRQQLAEFLNGDKQLFSLFNTDNAYDTIGKIGCLAVSEMANTNDYLKSLKPDSRYKLVWNDYANSSECCLYAINKESEKGALINKADIESVTFNYNKDYQSNEIAITLKKSAVTLWAEATKRNIQKAIAIVLDNTVISAPIVQTQIDGGRCTITGNFTKDEAGYIAALCNNSELPADFKIIK